MSKARGSAAKTLRREDGVKVFQISPRGDE